MSFISRLFPSKNPLPEVRTEALTVEQQRRETVYDLLGSHAQKVLLEEAEKMVEANKVKPFIMYAIGEFLAGMNQSYKDHRPDVSPEMREEKVVEDLQGYSGEELAGIIRATMKETATHFLIPITATPSVLNR